ncbi:MAG: hypothetical protein II652_02035 [Bacteroidales bacterium]|nr:hypothetical protein [Bacteroidales bacterium]
MQKVAKVLKSNGTDGELVLSLFDIVPEDLDLQEPVFIFHDGLPVPYFILSSRERGGRLLVRLTGVRSLEDADELVGREVFADYFEEENEQILLGWTVRDENGEPVGQVSGYEDIPGNLCIQVKTAKGEVLLPLHQDLVVQTDWEKGEITLRIPDGLLEL